MMQSSMASTQNPTNYHNLSFANGAKKVLRPPLAASWNLSLISGPIPQESTGGTGSSNQQMNAWPLDLTNITINKPSGTVRLDNDLRFKNNFTMTSSRLDFGSNGLFINTVATGNYIFANRSWRNLANLHYNQIPHTLTAVNATFQFEDRCQGGIRSVQLLGDSPGGGMQISYTDIPGSN
ncbi:hypothetical protein MM239_09985 [Belliella sp. DSM 111904]|uniref:Uncharacterized protein n=1 Tax=Belliella filtrata TaxID=2923435 RepID=A0ABS9UZZ3_9BACT|nr:hypothetical protein [Belliella filtrata]MCH7409724.1 hypothetical protein [Belliella filtrata]